MRFGSSLVSQALRLFNTAGMPVSGVGGGSGTPSPIPSPSPTPSPTPASTPGTGGSPAASPSATPGQSAPGSTTPPTQTPTPDDIVDGDWRTMRTRYTEQKNQIAQLTAQSASLSKVHSQAKEMAVSLGYTDQDFTDAFATDPIRTLELLGQETRERAASQPRGQQPAPGSTIQPGDLAAQIAAEAQRQIAPINNIVNRQITEAAMTRYNQTLDQHISADPILKDAPPEITSIVKDYLGEYFSSQPAILLAMKEKGDFSAVPDALKFVSNRLHSGFKAWLAKSAPPQPGGAPPVNGLPAPGGKKPTLDDFINSPELLGDRYKA